MAQKVILDNKSLENIDLASIIDAIYPIGAVYISTASTSPQTLFGGSWESIGTGRCLMGVDSSHAAGSTAEAGLPNITGEWDTTWNSDVRGFHNLTATGAFYRYSDTTKPGRITSEDNYANNSGTNGMPYFDASRSNSIYGNSSTVQPPAYYVYMWRRIK